MFAAFPGWYATLFSGFYLALVLLLVALIVRGVSFEYRDKRESPRGGGGRWTVLTTLGSLVAPLLLGIALGGLLTVSRSTPSRSSRAACSTSSPPTALFVGVTLRRAVRAARRDVPRAEGGRARA